MPQIILQDPRDIDCEPADAGSEALHQLGNAIYTIEQLLPSTLAQVRSSYLTRLLDRAPSTPPDALGEAWEDSDLHGYVLRFMGAVVTSKQLAERAVAELED